MSGLAVGMMVGMNLAAYLEELMGLTDVWLAIGGMQLVTSFLMMLTSVSVERAISRNKATVESAPQDHAKEFNDAGDEPYSLRASDVAASGFSFNSFHAAGDASRREVELRQRITPVTEEL